MGQREGDLGDDQGGERHHEKVWPVLRGRGVPAKTTVNETVKVKKDDSKKKKEVAHDGSFQPCTDRIAKVAILCAVIGARAGVMFTKMVVERPIRAKLKRLTKAARTIQKFVRPIIWSKKGKIIRAGMIRLKAVIAGFKERYRIKRQERSVKVLLKFQEEMRAQSEVKTAIGNYMRHVRRLQRTFRRYWIWKEYVLEVRRAQFSELESKVRNGWEKKKKKIEIELAKAENLDPDEIIGDFNMRRPPHRVSEAIREQLLLESFREDQIKMRTHLSGFALALEEFKLKLATWRSLAEAQQVVSSSKSMKQIMKDDPPPDRPRRPIVIPRLCDDDLWIMVKTAHARMDDVVPEKSDQPLE